jgi:hypothetical protein
MPASPDAIDFPPLLRACAYCNHLPSFGGGKYSMAHSPPLLFDLTWLAVDITVVHACDHPSKYTVLYKLPSLPRSLRRRQNNQTSLPPLVLSNPCRFLWLVPTVLV